MTSDPTFNELSALDGELLPERTVLSGVGGLRLPDFPPYGIDDQPLVQVVQVPHDAAALLPSSSGIGG